MAILPSPDVAASHRPGPSPNSCGLGRKSRTEKTWNQLAVFDIAEFEHLSTRLRFVQFDEHLASIRRCYQEKIDSLAVCAIPGCRIHEINAEFFLTYLPAPLHVHTPL